MPSAPPGTAGVVLPDPGVVVAAAMVVPGGGTVVATDVLASGSTCSVVTPPSLAQAVAANTPASSRAAIRRLGSSVRGVTGATVTNQRWSWWSVTVARVRTVYTESPDSTPPRANNRPACQFDRPSSG